MKASISSAAIQIQYVSFHVDPGLYKNPGPLFFNHQILKKSSIQSIPLRFRGSAVNLSLY